MRFDPDTRRLAAVLLATIALTTAGLFSLRSATQARMTITRLAETDAILDTASRLAARLGEHASTVTHGGSVPGTDLTAATTSGAVLSALSTLHELVDGDPRLEAAVRDVDTRTHRALSAGAAAPDEEVLRGVHEAIEGIAAFQARIVHERAALLKDAERLPFRDTGILAGAIFLAVATMLGTLAGGRRGRAGVREPARTLDESDLPPNAPSASPGHEAAATGEVRTHPQEQGVSESVATEEAGVRTVFIPSVDGGAGDPHRPAGAIWEGLHAVLAGDIHSG